MTLRIGMIGGGEGAFIGAVHRMAMRLDGRFQLTAGCFSSREDVNRRTAAHLGIAPGRTYPDFETMADGEAALPEGERIQAVAIVTPNHLHHGPAIRFLERGFHVLCEKPLTTDMEKAHAIAAAVRDSGRVFVLAHNYTAYPMIREARERIRRGDLGRIRKVHVEYLQGWLSEPLEESGHPQAAWRTDPSRAGPTGALGDIGTHAFNLLEHVTGLSVRRVFAHMNTFVADRRLDDDDMVLLDLSDDAAGVLCVSQVAFGRENGLMLRVFGEKGSLAWRQEHPEDLEFWEPDGTLSVLRPMGRRLTPSTLRRSRVPPGHPEGYIESFANLYASFANAIEGKADMEAAFPGVEEGMREMLFLEACLESSRRDAWKPVG